MKDVERNLYELFAEQATTAPEAVAIVAENSTTYHELLARVDEIAAFLQMQSLSPEESVGVSMERSPDLVATLLAVLKCGASYVPCEPTHPIPRTQRMLELARARLVLGDTTTPTQLSDVADVIRVETIGPSVVSPPASGQTAARCAPGGARKAYTMFTSGSTGEPKGVEVEHRSLLNLLFAAGELIGFTKTDCYLAASTVTFDISVAELFLPLIGGGSLLLRGRLDLLNPRALADDIRRHGVTVVQAGPSVWANLLREVPDFPRVRVAISTGEAISTELAGKLVHYGDQVWNLYGPTEATVWATGQLLRSSHRSGSQSSHYSAPIGAALANVIALVVDEDGHPVSDGQTGELWIGGLGVARGYCGNPCLTDQRFVRGPGGQRYYRSGDLVKRVGEELHYLGRSDDQVQILGVRVEPKEVESAVLRNPAVAQTAATWFAKPNGGRSIGAAVVLESGKSTTEQQIRRSVADLLPSQMVPARLAFVHSLPLSSSGKVDRDAIRDALSRDNIQTAPIAESARTPTEQVVCHIFEDLLGLQHVAPGDHFLPLGGDSIAAFRLLLEIEAEFDVRVELLDIFDLSVGRLAAKVASGT